MKDLIGWDSEWCNCGCDYYLLCSSTGTRFRRLRPSGPFWLDDVVAFHNPRADFRALGYYPPVAELYDSLMLSWLFDENGRHGLKHLSEDILGRKLEEPIRVLDGQTQFKVGSRFVHITDAPQELVEQYCQEDAKATRDLALHFWSRLGDKEKEQYLKIEREYDRLLFDMERRGIALDIDKMVQETYDLGIEAEQAEVRAYELTGYEFNIDSPKQLGGVLYEETWTTQERRVVGTYSTGREKVRWVDEERAGFGLTPTRRTPSGAPSTDDDALNDLDHPIVEAVLDYRANTKVLNTYLTAFPRYLGADERLRGHFNSTGTVTGRLSSSEPNLQNIPARGELGKRVRSLFVPGPGRVLVVADLDQVEYRLLAAFSGEQELIEAFLNGEDIHQRTATLMGVEERAVGKTFNYAISYGAGVGKVQQMLLQQGIKLDRKEVKKLLNRYKDALPAVELWKDKVLRYARSNRVVLTLDGRTRHLVGINSHDVTVRMRAERQAINSVIQGSAADIVKHWALEVNRYEFVDLLLQVHDELVAETPLHQGAPGCEAMVEGLERAMERWPLTVPITTQAKVCYNWGEK